MLPRPKRPSVLAWRVSSAQRVSRRTHCGHTALRADVRSFANKPVCSPLQSVERVVRGQLLDEAAQADTVAVVLPSTPANNASAIASRQSQSRSPSKSPAPTARAYTPSTSEVVRAPAPAPKPARHRVTKPPTWRDLHVQYAQLKSKASLLPERLHPPRPEENLTRRRAG